MLSDVFGIRLGGFEETEVLNEISRKFYTGKKLELTYKGKPIDIEAARFDMIEPRGAEVIGSLTSLDKEYPIMTSHRYGKGKAIYVGLPAKGEILNPLIDDLINELSMKRGPNVPEGVMARQIDDHHLLYLNVSDKPKKIVLKGKSRSLLFDKNYVDGFTIEPFEPEFLELE